MKENLKEVGPESIVNYRAHFDRKKNHLNALLRKAEIDLLDKFISAYWNSDKDALKAKDVIFPSIRLDNIELFLSKSVDEMITLKLDGYNKNIGYFISEWQERIGDDPNSTNLLLLDDKGSEQAKKSFVHLLKEKLEKRAKIIVDTFNRSSKEGKDRKGIYTLFAERLEEMQRDLAIEKYKAEINMEKQLSCINYLYNEPKESTGYDRRSRMLLKRELSGIGFDLIDKIKDSLQYLYKVNLKKIDEEYKERMICDRKYFWELLTALINLEKDLFLPNKQLLSPPFKSLIDFVSENFIIAEEDKAEESNLHELEYNQIVFICQLIESFKKVNIKIYHYLKKKPNENKDKYEERLNNVYQLIDELEYTRILAIINNINKMNETESQLTEKLDKVDLKELFFYGVVTIVVNIEQSLRFNIVQ